MHNLPNVPYDESTGTARYANREDPASPRHGDIHDRAEEQEHNELRKAVLHGGRAIITTSLSLSLGFLTLAASAWQSISSFGLFVSLAILAALAAALVVLPALIIACTPRHAPVPASQQERPDPA